MTDQNNLPQGEPPEAPPQPTWDDVRKQRDNMLLAVERLYNFDSPDEIKNAFAEFKQQLRDLPETYKDLEDLNQIEWPPLPMFTQQLNRSRL